MKLIDVTNSHARLVQNQLESTDAQLVKVYSLGNTTVTYTDAPRHIEILFINRTRNVRSDEIEFVKDSFTRKYNLDFTRQNIDVIQLKGAVEISLNKIPQPNKI